MRVGQLTAASARIADGNLVIPRSLRSLADDSNLIMTNTLLRDGWMAYILPLKGLARIVLRTDPAWDDRTEPLPLDEMDQILIQHLVLNGGFRTVDVERGRLKIPLEFGKWLPPGKVHLIQFPDFYVLTKGDEEVAVYKAEARDTGKRSGDRLKTKVALGNQ